MYKKALTPEQAVQKLKQYCGYQERSHAEVSRKLYELGVWRKEHDEIISRLIEGDYLNEERFVKAFAGGKWRMKKWGRVKIRHELKTHQISDYLIRTAMMEIPEQEYLEVLDRELAAKYESLKSDQYMIRQKKTRDFMIGRGFEPELVNASLQSLIRARRSDS